jgi:hypothetical protein
MAISGEGVVAADEASELVDCGGEVIAADRLSDGGTFLGGVVGAD